MMNNNALILLASYNGEQYIEQAVESFPCDTVDILISDDGSTDRTLDVLSRYVYAHNLKNVSIKSGVRHGGSTRNFLYLINNCPKTYDYYFLADQDDCWTRDKYELMCEEMRSLECKHGSDVPILIFGDSIVVDKNMNVIADSFFAFDGINPAIINNPRNIFFQNIGQGATMMFNNQLLKDIKPIKGDVYMHDWWLVMFAYSFGVLHLSSHKTLLYRQHGSNQIGAKQRGLIHQIRSQISGESKIKKHLNNVKGQMKIFSEFYSDCIKEKKDISVFLTDFNVSGISKSLFKRKWFLIRNKIYLSSFKRTLVLYLFF